jgi:tRNA nucleotidyltransferase/poly(A) polymerase
METFSAMRETSNLLSEISMDRRRQEFMKLIVSKNTGKALRMCVSANVMPTLFGEAYPPKGRKDFGNLEELLQNIDQGRVEALTRMALVFLCFNQKKALKALEDMHFDGESEKKLREAITLMEDLYFASDNYLMKRFIYSNGMETYDFLTSVCKQQRDVYNVAAFRIASRYYILDDIRKNHEPIFVEDLAINAEDLIREKIAEGEQVGKTLSMLADVVHRFPGMNTKPKLLKKAKQLKNPWQTMLRNYHLVK